jgi:hypothetical protein
MAIEGFSVQNDHPAAQPSLAERIRAYQPLAIVSIIRGVEGIVNAAAVATRSKAPR